MKTQKLIPLLDYVLEVHENEPKPKNFSDFGQIPDYKKIGYDLIHNYAKFLSQPLRLSQFVPCDPNGIPLDQFIHIIDGEMSGDWNKAKSNVLFEGFEVKENKGIELTKSIAWKGVFHVFWFSSENKDWMLSKSLKNIESLTKYGLTLTENAVKTINR